MRKNLKEVETGAPRKGKGKNCRLKKEGDFFYFRCFEGKLCWNLSYLVVGVISYYI
ncbi:hypothetical protein ERO13_D08G097250v2 [Gossypium hirsutum]|nr:hypothetical protein ERO13_D08G097250v2 [Gossypium hirsutum]